MRRIRASDDEREDDVDLNPLIDIVTLLIVFFILGGRITTTSGREQITVPPATIGLHEQPAVDWERIEVDVQRDGAAHDGSAVIGIGTHRFRVSSTDASAYAPIRALLDRVWDRSSFMVDAHGRTVPRVTLALRADADAPYRVVQELQQIAGDTVDPAGEEAMAPRRAGTVTRPFPSIEYVVRPLDARPVLR